MSIYSNQKRKHDSFYKNEDHFTNPKEYFKKAELILSEKLEKKRNNIALDFLDIGCAAGDFIRYIHKTSRNKLDLNFFGTDVMDELLIEAKERCPYARFGNCDLSEKETNISSVFNTKFDFISMLSVHAIFDDLFWINNIFDSLKKDGYALIWGLFNPYPYDVIMRVKKSGEEHLEPGWNVHSKKSVFDRCKTLGAKCEFLDFEPDIVLKKDKNDFLRSWNFDISGPKNDIFVDPKEEIFEQKRKRIFTNATRIIHDFSFCIIKK